MLKRASRAAPASRKTKVAIAPKLHHLLRNVKIVHQLATARKPHSPGQNRRSNAKSDHVGQRVQFASKRAGGVGQPRDAAVEEVEHDGNADGLGRLVEVPRIACRALNGLRNGVIAGCNVDRREHGRQEIQALAFRARLARDCALGRPLVDRSSHLRSVAARRQPRRLGTLPATERASSDIVTQPDFHLRRCGKDHVDPRAKLDKPDALSARHVIANFLVEHNAARQQARQSA